jgi:hypothetical protein
MMSIYPKLVIKGKIKKVTLHMRVRNYSSKSVKGTIVFRVKRPDGKTDVLKRRVTVTPKSSVDKFLKYSIEKKPIGKYIVDGRFYFDKTYVRSSTWKNDFFEVVRSEKEKSR